MVAWPFFALKMPRNYIYTIKREPRCRERNLERKPFL